MKLALLMTVCQAEERIGRDALRSAMEACRGAQWRLLLVDDASPGRVGQRLAEEVAGEARLGVDVLELPEARGYRGVAYRLFAGLSRLAKWDSGDVDWVVKLDPDALVLGTDLPGLLAKQPHDRVGLLGAPHTMRRRDAALVLADLLPMGFRRRQRGVVIEHGWELRRWRPVWWAGFGIRALWRGFRFRYVPGGMCFLGGRTLRALHERGYLDREQDGRQGLMFGDDVLVSMAVAALGHPLVDLATYWPGWAILNLPRGQSAEATLAEGRRPFVVHPLKDGEEDWSRRRALADGVRAMATERER